MPGLQTHAVQWLWTNGIQAAATKPAGRLVILGLMSGGECDAAAALALALLAAARGAARQRLGVSARRALPLLSASPWRRRCKRRARARHAHPRVEFVVVPANGW